VAATGEGDALEASGDSPEKNGREETEQPLMPAPNPNPRIAVNNVRLELKIIVAWRRILCLIKGSTECCHSG
jgi:hypothetical protein